MRDGGRAVDDHRENAEAPIKPGAYEALELTWSHLQFIRFHLFVTQYVPPARAVQRYGGANNHLTADSLRIQIFCVALT